MTLATEITALRQEVAGLRADLRARQTPMERALADYDTEWTAFMAKARADHAAGRVGLAVSKPVGAM